MITVQVLINAPLSHCWEGWINPKHIVHWYYASPDWCCPNALMDCKTGGSFSIRMEAKDKSFGFDFNATFSEVIEKERLHYTLEDGRLVELTFNETLDGTLVAWKFDPENQNPISLQQQGWQAILNHFKSYIEQEFVV
jgi:uncharacterized protein YndB with AHSA1/START domain